MTNSDEYNMVSVLKIFLTNTVLVRVASEVVVVRNAFEQGECTNVNGLIL